MTLSVRNGIVVLLFKGRAIGRYLIRLDGCNLARAAGSNGLDPDQGCAASGAPLFASIAIIQSSAAITYLKHGKEDRRIRNVITEEANEDRAQDQGGWRALCTEFGRDRCGSEPRTEL
jgi:hypothetical protein